MTLNMKHLFAALVAAAVIGGQGAADELVIARGKKLEGRIAGFENNELTFVTADREFSVDISQVRDIRTDSDDPKVKALVEDLRRQIEEVDRKKQARQEAWRRTAERQRMEDMRDRIQEEARKEQEDQSTTRMNISKKRVAVFIQEGCPWCKKMEKFLKSRGVKYTRYDIDKDEAARKIYEAKGGDGGVPFLVIDDNQVLSGYDPEAVMAVLKM